VSDTLALGCFLEFQKLGYHEIEVSGFDNSPISKEFGFSSLDQNLSKVAQGALGILMGDTGNQIKKINYNEEQTAAHLLLAPNLISR
jgi:DNA-binding LacI/PurR family transcriptional regulator